jgi:3-hydroxybutyryl-CoA dehydrogenase
MNMHLVIKSSQIQKAALLTKGIPVEVIVIWFELDEIIPEADAYFDLCYETEGPAFSSIINKPVFLNAVIERSEELPNNNIRLNAWNSFLERPLLELVSNDEEWRDQAESILIALNWKYHWVPDVPGMIAARVIAMIINEAFFGFGEGISTEQEIDTAMKLGTNYPFGPFEWSEKIGLSNIHALLQKLSLTDKCYEIAPALEDRYQKIIQS